MTARTERSLVLLLAAALRVIAATAAGLLVDVRLVDLRDDALVDLRDDDA